MGLGSADAPSAMSAPVSPNVLKPTVEAGGMPNVDIPKAEVKPPEIAVSDSLGATMALKDGGGAHAVITEATHADTLAATATTEAAKSPSGVEPLDPRSASILGKDSQEDSARADAVSDNIHLNGNVNASSTEDKSNPEPTGSGLTPEQKSAQATLDALVKNGGSVADISIRMSRGEQVNNPFTGKPFSQTEVQGLMQRQRELNSESVPVTIGAETPLENDGSTSASGTTAEGTSAASSTDQDNMGSTGENGTDSPAPENKTGNTTPSNTEKAEPVAPATVDSTNTEPNQTSTTEPADSTATNSQETNDEVTRGEGMKTDIDNKAQEAAIPESATLTADKADAYIQNQQKIEQLKTEKDSLVKLLDEGKKLTPDQVQRLKQINNELNNDPQLAFETARNKVKNNEPLTDKDEAALSGELDNPEGDTRTPEEIQLEQEKQLSNLSEQFARSFLNGDLENAEKFAQEFNRINAENQGYTVSEAQVKSLSEFLMKSMRPEQIKDPKESARMKKVKDKLMELSQLEMQIIAREKQAEDINKEVKNSQTEAAKAEDEYYNETDSNEKQKKLMLFQGHVLRVQSLLDVKKDMQEKWLKDDINRRVILGDIHRMIGSKGLIRNLMWGAGTLGRQAVFGGVQAVSYPTTLFA